MRGEIVRLVADRRFGFIRAADGREYFFHQSDLVNAEYEALKEKDKVTFEEHATPKGLRAGGVIFEG